MPKAPVWAFYISFDLPLKATPCPIFWFMKVDLLLFSDVFVIFFTLARLNYQHFCHPYITEVTDFWHWLSLQIKNFILSSGLQLRKSEQNSFHDNFLISQPNPMMWP